MSSMLATSRETILIVDDVAANLRLLSQILLARGYDVRAVTSGARALASIQATPPDLVLLDIRMPEMDGFEVCKRLKDDVQYRDVPIIFISALDDIQDKVKGFALGGVDYITKPFQLEEVLARVETHLSLRRLQKQIQQANARFEKELALAGSLQASLLPDEAPAAPGWDICMTLKPARETSGDFYDVYALPDGQLALLVADVVDKGAAAALFMAMSWMLIRTYEAQFPSRPEALLGTINREILRNTDGSYFVTMFYGVLDTATGQLVYCSAGHTPPVHVRGGSDTTTRLLAPTGMALGILDEQTWRQDRMEIAHGDVVVLCTDGITEACDAGGDLYGMDRLATLVSAHVGQPARAIQAAILDDVRLFTGDLAQTDDIALVVVVREPAPPPRQQSGVPSVWPADRPAAARRR